jgi:hypothetical protein
MFTDKPNFKPLDKEYVSVGNLIDFINKNHIMRNVPIWIEFGDGNGTFLRTDAGKNWKTDKGLTFDDDTLRINLSPSCLAWRDINTIHPVVLSVDKCGVSVGFSENTEKKTLDASGTMITDEQLDDWKDAFPIDLLTEEERQKAIEIAKRGYTQSVKYIKSLRSDFGLKSAKIYYDLYINKENYDTV